MPPTLVVLHNHQTDRIEDSRKYARRIENYNAILLSKQRIDLERGQSRSEYIVAWSDDWSRMCGENSAQQGTVK